MDHKINEMCERQITNENKPKIRPKLISIPTRENEENQSPENRSCLDIMTR